jgi:membrane protein
MWNMVVQFERDVRRAAMRWYEDDGPLMSAATAYYVGLSFFPLLIVLIAGVEWFLRNTHLGQDAQQKVLAAIAQNMSPELADYVRQSLAMVLDKSGVGGPVGLATMLITSVAAFAQLDSAFDRIWATPQSGSHSIFTMALRLILQRGRALLLLLGLAGVVLVVFLAGIVQSAIEAHTALAVPLDGWLWDAVQTTITFAINTVVFTFLYRLLPKLPVRWGDALHGGMLTAAAWEIGRQLLTIYIARSHYGSAYGVVGAFLAVLLWCYYAVAIVLLGAEYVQVIHARSEEISAGGE